MYRKSVGGAITFVHLIFKEEAIDGKCFGLVRVLLKQMNHILNTVAILWYFKARIYGL